MNPNYKSTFWITGLASAAPLPAASVKRGVILRAATTRMWAINSQTDLFSGETDLNFTVSLFYKNFMYFSRCYETLCSNWLCK